MPGLSRLFLLSACVLALTSCSEESRTAAPDAPQTAPASAGDPRAEKYEHNVYQISQGGRYFTWYGCGECHGANAKAALKLSDAIWVHGGDLTQVYGFIAHGHPGQLAHYGERIPVEQLWQITAYVRNLPHLEPEKRFREEVDQRAEPQGAKWMGPFN